MTATATTTRRTPARPQPQKPRRSWRRRAVALTAVVLVLALLGGSLWLVYFSNVLVTKRVNIVGVHNLAPTQVSLAAQIPLGVPLARQHLDAIAARATTLRAIESATVTRKWPDTVTVRVVERQPVLAVHDTDDYVIVDKFGVAFQTQSTLPSNVVLTDLSPGNAPLLSEVATVAAALSNKLRGKVGLITASSPDSIVLILGSGRKVIWGSSADSGLKAEVVTALLEREPSSAIDVSSPHNPAVRA